MAVVLLALVAVWLYLLLGRGGFWLMREPPQPAGSPAAGPRVAAVIPARNEAPFVGRAIASLVYQHYFGELQIVLVDDNSTDGTGKAACGAAPPALLAVVRAGPPKPGWTGKMWAVAEGVRHAASFDPEFYLFTDADIVHGPGTLAALTARARTENYDLVSYMATLHCETLAERALIPAFVFFFFMLYPPAWIRNPRRRTAGAAGGCILIRRAMLERIGGIEAIAGELIDDCALARAVKRAGGRVWLGLSRETRSIRPYAGFGEIERMISRTAYTQLRHSPWLLAGTLVGLCFTYLLPPVLAIGAHGIAAAAGACAWLLMSAAYFPALRYYRLWPLWAPLLPLAAAFYAGATLHSAVSYWRGKGGQWKGRAQDAAKA
jgi:hopene-associated glycosyltransferase HpnB